LDAAGAAAAIRNFISELQFVPSRSCTGAYACSERLRASPPSPDSSAPPAASDDVASVVPHNVDDYNIVKQNNIVILQKQRMFSTGLATFFIRSDAESANLKLDQLPPGSMIFDCIDSLHAASTALAADISRMRRRNFQGLFTSRHHLDFALSMVMHA
jgi:hypothetical protein